jgi:hypothetical protein
MTRAVMDGLAVDPDDGSSVQYKGNIFGFLTIDTPHKGSKSDWLMRFLSGASKDMVADSAFLKALNAVSVPTTDATVVSVAVGNAMGYEDGDGLFSVDEQTPGPGTVPSSTAVRCFPVVHGRGILAVDYGKYTAAQDSPEVRGWAKTRYLQAQALYQASPESPAGPPGPFRPVPLPDSRVERLGSYLLAFSAWGLALWLGVQSGVAGFRPRSAWAIAVGVFVVVGICSATWDASALSASAFALPGSYLVGWWRAGR